VHLSIFILVVNQLNAQNLFYNKFISCLYMFRTPCDHRQEVKIVLYSLWYRHTYRWPSRGNAGSPDTTLANRTQNPTHTKPRTNSANVVVQQHSRKLLKMGILMPGTC